MIKWLTSKKRELEITILWNETQWEHAIAYKNDTRNSKIQAIAFISYTKSMDINKLTRKLDKTPKWSNLLKEIKEFEVTSVQ